MTAGAERRLAIGTALHAADAAPQHVTFGAGRAFVTSGDAGVAARAVDHAGRELRTTPIPVGSYNVQYGFGRVITASLGRGNADGARRARRAARARAGLELVPRRVFLRRPEALRKPYRIAGGSFRRCREHGTDEATAPPRRARGLPPRRSPHRRRPPAPCRNDIYDDWYHDGKIASTYPIACYRDAIKHVHGDAADLLEPDGRHPRRDAGRDSPRHGKSNVPTQVGKGCRSRVRPGSEVDSSTNRRLDAAGRRRRCLDDRVARRSPTRRGSGVPVPLLVLGGLALLLAAAGGLGMLARRRGDALRALAAERHEPPEARPLRRQVEAERQQQQRVDDAERDREQQRAGLRSRRRSARSRRPLSVSTRRHWYGTGIDVLRVDRHADEERDVGREPSRPRRPSSRSGGISAKLSAMFTTAAMPLTIQLNCVRRARPMPIASTV